MADIKSMTSDELMAYVQKQRESRTEITYKEALDYEIRASWWAPWVSIGWMQDIAARYFAWKVKRKMRRVRSW